MDQYNPEEVLNLVQDEVKKAVTATSYTFSPPSRSIFSPENLDPEIKILVPVTAPVRRILPRTAGFGQAAGWQQLTSRLDPEAGGTGTSVGFADAGTPAQTTQTYVFKSAAYKNLGRDVAIGRQAIAANRNGKTVEDLRAHEERVKLMEVMLGEEDMILNGNASLDPTTFDGLSTSIVTNSGTAGFLTASGVSSFTASLFQLGNEAPTHIVVSARQARALSDDLTAGGGVQRVVQGDSTNLRSGIHVNELIDSTTGNVVQIVTSRYVGLWAYILTVHSPAGENWLEMEDLEPLSAYDVPISTHAVQSRVYETTVLKNIAEVYQYKVAVGA